MSSSSKVALVYGGSGALGSVVVSTFVQHQWQVISIDLRPNSQAFGNILLSLDDSWEEQSQKVLTQLNSLLKQRQLNSCICVAGGWAGGSAADSNLIKTAELMWKQSVQTSLICSRAAASHLAPGGLVVLTGAKAALSGTGGMIGYGIAKAAVHQLVKSLSTKESGLPADSKSLCIMPIVLDTPANRNAMPSADHSSWTPLKTLAEQLYQWSDNVSQAPESGSLIEVVTRKGETSFTPVQHH